MDLEGYSHEAEAFNSRLARSYYRHFAGLDGHFDRGTAYRAHAHLFAPQAIDALRALAHDGATERSRRGAALLRFAVEGSLGAATAAADAELTRREASLSVQVSTGGPGRGIDRLGLGEALAALASEPDPDRRHELDRARRLALDSTLRPLALEVIEQRHAHSRELGWTSYAQMCSELGNVDLDALDGDAQALLAATDQAYATALERSAGEILGTTAARLRRCDLPRLLSAPGGTEDFPAARLLPVAAQTLSGMGLDLHGNVALDLHPRRGKSVRAFCVPVRIPQEIYLVLAPVGGRADYRALLHEAGHAQHFAGADESLPSELRRLGDPAVGEAFAFLFEEIVDEPAWRRRQLGLDTGEAGAAHARAQRLLLLRRYAAKLSYERELHDADHIEPSRLSASYARRLSQALHLKWPPEPWLTDVDPGMYVVSYLRGWTLASALRRVLSERFGVSWFEQRDAGRLLRRLWREGQRLRAEEVLALVDPAARLSFADLALEFAG